MSPEPSAEELKAGLEQAFERWRNRLEEPAAEPAADEPAAEEDADESAAA